MSQTLVPHVTSRQLRDAYRALYKASLAAVQRASPARYTVRNILRGAFRDDYIKPADVRRPSARTTSASTSTTTSASTSTTTSSTTSTSKTTEDPPFRLQPPRRPPVPAPSFDPQRVANTLTFLRDAAATTGLAHRIVKGLVHTRYWDQQLRKDRWRGERGRYPVAYDHEVSVAARKMHAGVLEGLNESMGLCLR